MAKITPEALKGLTKEKKLQLLTLIEEKKRRARLNPELFKPHSTQLPFHKSEKKIRVVVCSNGWGKTAAAVNEVLWAMKGYNPVLQKYTKVPARVVVVLDKPDKVEQVWLREMRKWHHFDELKQFHKKGKPYVAQITMDNGSELIFMFHEQEMMSFESIESDYFVYDEPPPRRVFIALARGGRAKGSPRRHTLVGTPITGAWIRKELYEPWARGERPDIECFRGTVEENRSNLAEGYIEDFSRLLTEKERRIRLHGDFFDLEGLALAHLFDRSAHVIEHPAWDYSNPVVIGVDPHPQKAHIAVMLGCDRDGHYYYLSELVSTRDQTPRDFAREMRKWYQGYRVADIICDSLGSGPLTGGDGNKSFIEVLNDEGVRARATTWEDKKEQSWLMRIQEVLAIPKEPDQFGQCIPRLRIVEGNNGIIENIESVQWLKMRNLDEYKPHLDISNKDFLAALKYALAANLSYQSGRGRIYRNPRAQKAYGIGR